MKEPHEIKEEILLQAIELQENGKPIQEIMALFPEYKKEIQEAFDTIEILKTGKDVRPRTQVLKNILEETHPKSLPQKRILTRWVFTLSGAVAVILLFTLTYTQLGDNTIRIAQSPREQTSSFEAQKDSGITALKSAGESIEVPAAQQEAGLAPVSAPGATLAPQGTRDVQIFFSSIVEDPNLLRCNTVYSVTRTVPNTPSIEKAAINELVDGLKENETKDGFRTQIKPGVKLQTLTIADGVAHADFNEALDPGGGSCAVTAIRAQIEETLKQFPTVDTVIISINGRTEDILQP